MNLPKASTKRLTKLRNVAPSKPPIRLILGPAGAGKSRQGEKEAKKFTQKVFLAITAALVQEAPKTFQSKFTIAAFLARKVKVNPNTVIYIDEISMVPAHTLNKLLAQNPQNHYIMTGDQFQIKPILQPGENKDKCWWFTAEEYKKRTVHTQILKEQHRLTGNECTLIRSIIDTMATPHADEKAWKEKLVHFIAQRRTKTPPQNARIIVFTNEDLKHQTEKWAKKNKLTLDTHGLVPGMPVVITTNKPHQSIPQEYEHRNGQRGTLLAIKKRYAAVKDAQSNNIIKVKHKKGHIPQIKSGIAETADSAQGKTIKEPVHIIINKHIPDLAHFIVAATRSKITTFNTSNNSMATIEHKILNTKTCPQIIHFTNSLKTI